MNIHIQTIPHKEQRYDTVGDWWWTEDGDIEIRVSDMKNWVYEIAIAVHELIEVALFAAAGGTPEMVDAFDLKFEKDRLKGKHSEFEEPGDHPKAPYHREHGFATAAERMFIAAADENWKDYEAKVNSL